MTIDTTTYGDAAQIRAAAEWLDPGLKDAADTVSNGATLTSTSVRGHWYGESADDYVTILIQVSDAAKETLPHARDAAEKFRSYAGQLERMKSDFSGHRERAADQGLPVIGNIIARPVCLVPVCPTSREDPYWDEWQAYLDQVEVYNEIAADVGAWWGELEVWIAENLDGFLGGLPEQSVAEKILTGLSSAGGTASRTYLNAQGLAWAGTARQLVTDAETLRTGASDFVRGLRSGNPAVRAAAEAANPSGMRWAADESEDLARRLARAGKVIPAVGWGIDVWSLGSALENEDDPSSTAVNIAGGVVGGIAATAAVGGLVAAGVITMPVWGTAAVVAGAAVAVGAGATWAYNEWVPQDVREAIDAGMSDGWDATTDFAEDAWENTGDFVGDVGDNIGKAWKGVFG